MDGTQDIRELLMDRALLERILQRQRALQAQHAIPVPGMAVTASEHVFMRPGDISERLEKTALVGTTLATLGLFGSKALAGAAGLYGIRKAIPKVYGAWKSLGRRFAASPSFSDEMANAAKVPGSISKAEAEALRYAKNTADFNARLPAKAPTGWDKAEGFLSRAGQLAGEHPFITAGVGIPLAIRAMRWAGQGEPEEQGPRVYHY
jgi:hypothetical protein